MVFWIFLAATLGALLGVMLGFVLVAVLVLIVLRWLDREPDWLHGSNGSGGI